MTKDLKQKQELESFSRLWPGGFFASNSEKRNQVGLENFLIENVVPNLTMLEIGCGRGRWTKFICENLAPEKIECVDALDEFHNGFWEYVGNDKRHKVNYRKVSDFNLSHVQDGGIDFVFSYDVWCHISLSSQDAYLESLSKKCKSGAKLLIMYADPKKYYSSEPENLWFIKADLRQPWKDSMSNEEVFEAVVEDCDGAPSAGRWYWVGMENFLKNCHKHGFAVLSEDLNIDKTNILTLLRKP
jgi:SAM-dependent methyltransferase